MPRGERPLDPGDGPLVRLAADLRQLRAAAGKPSYRELARRAHYSSTTLSDAAGGRRLPSLEICLAYVRACNGDEDEWRARWHDVAAELARDERPAEPAETDDRVPPYVGLAAFGTEDADRFFGREAVVGKLLRRLTERRFLALFGSSGEGKTSVLRAGLVPAFTAERSAPWLVLTPGPDPVEELAVHLARLTRHTPGQVHADLLAGPHGLHLTARHLLADRDADVDLLVVVDQFEEVFTLCTSVERRNAFLSLLLTAVNAENSRVRVVLGVRSDFYPHCARYPDLTEALDGAQVLLGAMTTDEFRHAVTRPATTSGCTLEGALLTQLVADAAGRTGTLPLVSHALLETWRRRRGNTLTLNGYHAAGGIRTALAQTAEQVYTALTEPRRHLARQILLRLTAPGDGTEDTKRRATRDELHALDDDVTPVLDALVSSRLVMVGDNTVEITHEALFQAWPRLRGWLAEDRDGQRLQRQLTEAATIWTDLDHDPGTLFRTTRLATTTAWVDRTRPALTDRERDFLKHSRTAETRERHAVRHRRQVLLAGVAVLLIAITAVVVPMELQRQETERIETSRRLATQPTRNSTEAARNALEAYSIHPTVEARTSVLNAAVKKQGEHTHIQVTDEELSATTLAPDGNLAARVMGGRVSVWNTATLDHVVELSAAVPFRPETGPAFSPDGQLLAAGDSAGDITIWRMGDHSVMGVIPTGSGVSELAFSPDGRTLIVAGWPHRITLWDVETRRKTGELSGPKAARQVLAISADGRTLATSGASGWVELWDLPSRSRTAELRIGPGTVFEVAFAPDGRLLAAAGEDGDVTLWNTATASLVARLTQHVGGAYGVAFDPGGRVLASTGKDGRLVLWDVVKRVEAAAIDVDDVGQPANSHLAGLRDVAFGRNGTLVAASSKSIHIWAGDLLPKPDGVAIQAIQIDADGATVSTLDGRGVLTTWRTTPTLRRTGQRNLVDAGVRWATGAFSGDRRRLAVMHPDAPVSLFDVGVESPASTVPGWPAPATQPRITAFSPDLRYALGTGTGEPDIVRDLGQDGVPPVGGTLPGGDVLTSLAFLPGNRFLAVANVAGTVLVTDVPTTATVATLQGHTGPVEAAASPDGRLLATTGRDTTVVLWDTTTWQQVGRMSSHSDEVWRAAFSPDSKLLATSDVGGNIVLWDVDSRTVWATLTNPSRQAGLLAWSPDGSTLAIGDEADTITAWRLDVDRAVEALCAELEKSDSPDARPLPKNCP